jgi:hypothetical protein
MSRRLRLASALIGLLAAAMLLAACGEEEHHSEVVEGQPLELGELRYNIAITRFLNPNDVEDSEYLAGLPEPPRGEAYLGVFLTIKNESEEEQQSAFTYQVTDTTGAEYDPIETENPYALEIGAPVPGNGELPIPDSTAATGVIEGAMLLFLVDQEVSENRPLELEISGPDGEGLVELDI